MSLQCVNSDQDIQILHFVKELKGGNVKMENFSFGDKCPLWPPLRRHWIYPAGKEL